MENAVAGVQGSKPRPNATSHWLPSQRGKVGGGCGQITPSSAKGIQAGGSGAREASPALEEDDRGREGIQVLLTQEDMVFWSKGWLLLPQVMEKNREMETASGDHERASCLLNISFPSYLLLL